MHTQKDRAIAGWIGRLGAAGAEHVMARFAMGRSWAYARLSRLVADGLLDQKTLLYQRPGLYLATALGLRWTGLERLGTYTVSPGGFEHAEQLATAAVALHRGRPGWELLSEREIRAEENDRGELLASAAVGELPNGRRALHRPDLALISPDERTLAIEVELSIKAPRRLAAICRGWARARHVSHVYYLATPSVEGAVNRAIKDVRARGPHHGSPAQPSRVRYRRPEQGGQQCLKGILDHLFLEIDIGLAVMVAGGWATAELLSREGLRWTWAWLGIPLAFLLSNVNVPLSLPLWGATLFACWWGASWHKQDVMHGADFAENARARVGVVDVIRTRQSKDAIKRDGWLKGDSLIVGRDTQGLPVSIPAGRAAGKHTLILGATGSGKTVSEAWIAGRLIEAGHAAIVIDPKGDQMLRSELMLAAQRRGARFREWTPEGPLAYNPYAQGTEMEIADKALSGEEFTEPHYLRQAQRYLGHAVRVMKAAEVTVTPASLMAHMIRGSSR